MSQSRSLYELVQQIDDIIGEPCSYEPKHTIALFTSIITQIHIDKYRQKLSDFTVHQSPPPLKTHQPITRAEKKVINQLKTAHYDTPRPLDLPRKVQFADSPPSYTNASQN